MKVLVAGGASGIGAATARLFTERGNDVVVGDIRLGGLETAKGRASAGVAHAVQFDATRLDSCEELVRTTTRLLGGLEAVVSTVGWTQTSYFIDETPEYWRQVLDINLMSAVYLTRAALRPLIETGGGTIVLTASEAGKVGTTGETMYASAKAGLIGFVKSVSREVARYGVRINATAPGVTETPMLRAQADQDRVINRTIRAIPLRRIAQPEEQAQALYFLASDEASYITGQTLSVGGGLSMNS